jgi:hypothetical protein
MKSKAKRAVQVKLGNVDNYELRMDVVEVYSSKTNICPLIDFDKETIVVPATIGMLKGYQLEELKSAAEECYMSALVGCIEEKWDKIGLMERLDIINFIGLPEDLEPSMDSEEMVDKIEEVSQNGHELYTNLMNIYEYIPNWVV